MLETRFRIPVVLIVTVPFESIARKMADSLGLPDLALVVVEHPVGDLPFDVIHARGASNAQEVIGALMRKRPATTETMDLFKGACASDEGGLLYVEGSQEAIDGIYISNGWSDGLPIVAPTETRVTAMLGRHLTYADTSIGRIAPSYGTASVLSVAVNAVMAGCLPEYFDVVLAAVRASIQPAFNLDAIQATTHPVAAMILVNGPIAARIGMNAGTNALGQGNRANATIGRALRLCLQNIGGGIPGVTDRATLGHPGKYTYCLAENEAESPWEPFHVARGWDLSASTVTLFGVEGPHNMNDPGSVSATELLKTFIGCMCTPGSNHHQYPRTEPLVLLSPEHARLLARQGYTRDRLAGFLFEKARMPLDAFSTERVERWLSKRRPVWFGPENGTGRVALADAPSDFLIGVAGGPGTHSVFIPSFGNTKSVTIGLDEA